MAGDQHTCLIMETNDQERESLMTHVQGLGMKAIHCRGLFRCAACTYEPDAILMGTAINAPELDAPFANVELYVRENQIPVLVPDSLKGQMLRRFDDVHVYLTERGIQAKLTHLAKSQAKRRQMREKMYQSLTAMRAMRSASFVFKTLEEAQAMARLISEMVPGLDRLQAGLMEVFVNAIEHGNLAISGKMRETLRQNETWRAEIEKRLAEAQYQDKTVTVDLKRYSKEIEIKVTDCGDGFDWQNTMERYSQSDQIKRDHRAGFNLIFNCGFNHVTYENNGRTFLAKINFKVK